jgi:hypothetical protein
LDLSLLDDDPLDSCHEQDLAAVLFDGLGKAIGDDLSAPLWKVGAFQIVERQAGAHQNRSPARGQRIVPMLTGEHGLQPGIVGAAVEELLEGRVGPARQ